MRRTYSDADPALASCVLPLLLLPLQLLLTVLHTASASFCFCCGSRSLLLLLMLNSVVAVATATAVAPIIVAAASNRISVLYESYRDFSFLYIAQGRDQTNSVGVRSCQFFQLESTT